MIQQNADQPILGTSESPDLLNREKFAAQTANAVIDLPKSSGFVLSIEGPWGYGKTSVLNLIQKQFDQLPSNKRPISCLFNPWMVGNAETLIQSFLVQLAASIGLTDHAENGRKAAKELLSYSSIFTALKFIPGAEPWASIIKDVIDSVGTTTEKISDLKKLDIDKQKSSTEEALKKLDKTIVVFIDDIDRLPPQEVFAMIRLIKAVGNFPKVVYILFFDSGYIQDSLKHFSIKEANEYLDKVIQTRLSLPKISEDDLEQLLNREYDSLPEAARKSHFPKIQERNSELYISGLRNLFETLRDIKRIFNRVRFIEPGCRGEVNLADLIALEAIALKAPSVYKHLRECPEAYIGVNPSKFTVKSSKELIKSLEKDRQKALDLVPDRLKESVSGLLEALFPLLKEHSVFGKSGDIAKRHGLINYPDRLAVALSAGVPSGEASYAAAIRFLNVPNDRDQILYSINEAKKFDKFITHLWFACNGSIPVDPAGFIHLIGKTIDSPIGLAAENIPTDIFRSSVCKKTWFLVEQILKNIPPQERMKILEEALTDANQLTLGAYAITELQAQHGAFSDDKALPPKNRWANTRKLKSLTNKWGNFAQEIIESRKIFNATKSNLILYRLRKFCPDKLEKVIEKLLYPTENFDRLIMALGAQGSDSNNGEYSEFDDEDCEMLGGPKFKNLAESRLHDPDITDRLRHILTAIVTGKKIYLADGTEARH